MFGYIDAQKSMIRNELAENGKKKTSHYVLTKFDWLDQLDCSFLNDELFWPEYRNQIMICRNIFLQFNSVKVIPYLSLIQ